MKMTSAFYSLMHTPICLLVPMAVASSLKEPLTNIPVLFVYFPVFSEQTLKQWQDGRMCDTKPRSLKH